MNWAQAWRIIVPASLRRLPADLQLAVWYLIATTAAIGLPVIRTSPLRVLLGLPLVLFVPGYLFIVALFPEQGSTSEDAADSTAETGIDGIERVALSFGTSIAIVPLIGLILNFTPFGIRLVPILTAILIVCLTTLAIAARRRHELPPAERFQVDVRGAITTAWTELTTAESQTDAALNVLLVISVLLAVGSVGYAVAVPKQGEAFTEFYLLTENEDGELTADEYPTELTRGEPVTLTVGIGNHEHEPVNYSVVVVLQRATLVNETGSNETIVRVQEQQQLHELQTRLEHNETWHEQHSLRPQMIGSQLRLTYLLYRGSPPATPSTDTAYRELHLWVNVTAPTTSQDTTARIKSNPRTGDLNSLARSDI